MHRHNRYMLGVVACCAAALGFLTLPTSGANFQDGGSGVMTVTVKVPKKHIESTLRHTTPDSPAPLEKEAHGPWPATQEEVQPTPPTPAVDEAVVETPPEVAPNPAPTEPTAVQESAIQQEGN